MLEQYIQNNYLRALAILLILSLGLKIITVVTTKIILRLTKKTKTEIDDYIVEKTHKPITFLLLLVGLRVAIREIHLQEPFESIIYNIILSLMVVVFSILGYVILSGLVRVAAHRSFLKTKIQFDEGLFSFMSSILKIIVAFFIFVYILHIWGVQIGPFLAGIGVVGIAVAFAMQSTLSNIFGGVSILWDRTFKKGDLIYLDQETSGEVLHVGLRSTRILTFDNEMIIIPNGVLANTKIKNIAKPEPKTRVVVPFSVAYGADIEKVKKIVLSEIKQMNISKEPKPFVAFVEMASSSLNFKAFFYVDKYSQRFSAIDEANTRIYNALNKHNIEIPFPQLDVHLKKR
ncbi:MAG: mechanosensitive ion channel family protein [Candidatus Woesearchaeota archaeon]